MLPPNCEFVVNLAPELVEIIAEAKYLEKLGYPIPELAHSVTLQEDKYTSYQESLHQCLQRYHAILGQLNEAQVSLCVLLCAIIPSSPCLQSQLLTSQVQSLHRVLKPGIKRLNWNSLGIPDYVSRCEQAIIKFESLVNQVQKNDSDIEERLHLIESVKLFEIPPTKPGCDLPEAKVSVTKIWITHISHLHCIGVL